MAIWAGRQLAAFGKGMNVRSQISSSVAVGISCCRVMLDRYSFVRNVAGRNAPPARGQEILGTEPTRKRPGKIDDRGGHVTRVDVVIAVVQRVARLPWA